MDESELEQLLTYSRETNLRNDITGILLYHDGNFLQLLEGPQRQVQETIQRIQRDTRHKGIIPLLTRSYPKRSFEGWSMGYVRCTESKFNPTLPGFSVLLEKDSIQDFEMDHIPSPIRDLIRSFHRIVYKINMKIVQDGSFTF